MKRIYTALRHAFLQHGIKAPDFDVNDRPKKSETLDINIVSLTQAREPFDVSRANVTLTFSGKDARREDLEFILLDVFASFVPEADRYGVTPPTHDNTAQMVILEPPHFDSAMQEVDAKTTEQTSAINVTFFCITH